MIIGFLGASVIARKPVRADEAISHPIFTTDFVRDCFALRFDCGQAITALRKATYAPFGQREGLAMTG